MSTYHRIPVQWMGLNDIPAIPVADLFDIKEMLAHQLPARARETKQARQGLSTFYTIGDEYATGLEFMYGRSKPLFSFTPKLDEHVDVDMSQPSYDIEATVDVGVESTEVGEPDPTFDPAATARDDLLSMLESDPDHVLNLLNQEDYLRSNELEPSADETTVSELPDAQAMAIFGRAKPLTNLSLVDPKQWAMSLTTYEDIYQNALHLLPAWTESLTDADEASRQFWPTIANYGLAYNLLILQKVGDAQIADLRDKFNAAWTVEMDALSAAGQLYAIDLGIFTAVEPQTVDGFDRFTPATITLLVQDPESKAITPVAIRVSRYKDQDAQIYTRDQATPSAWLYALQAAKTSVTVYGIWLGHVYHWHIVTAALQMTLHKNISAGHAISQLLLPQSKYLITFDTVLLLPFMWEKIAPPTSIRTPFIFLDLCNTFAKHRTFFDDDPIATIHKLGLDEADFSLNDSWDQYPIVAKYLDCWQATKEYVIIFVDESYANDASVAADVELQAWIAESGDRDGGNISGLPIMDNRDALKRVLTSLIYRITMHGASRLSPNANPGLTFVANFPPCLQETSIPSPDSRFDSEQLLKFLPRTGVIGEMISFYFTFVFSSPYESFIPDEGIEADLFFPGEMSDLRNHALVNYRKAVMDLIHVCYGSDRTAQINQWPRNIET